MIQLDDGASGAQAYKFNAKLLKEIAETPQNGNSVNRHN